MTDKMPSSCERRDFIAGASMLLLGAGFPSVVAAQTPAGRVVCLGGAVTEILYALGLQGQIVAVDSTSQYPANALKEKRNVGYLRAISAEGVLAMRPTMIIAMKDAGPPQAMAQLRAAKIKIVTLDTSLAPTAVTGRVRQLAALFNVKARGEQLCAKIDGGFRTLDAYRRSHPVRKKVLFVLSLQNGRPMVAGKGTEADAMIALAGGVNAAGALSGYKPVGNESLAALAPDAILAMDHAGPGIDASALNSAGFRLTPAGRNKVLIKMDGSYLLGLGPRTPAAALDLARRLQAI